MSGERDPIPPIEDVLDQISDAVVLLDRELRCVYLSRRGTEMIGLGADEVVGRHVLEVFPELAGTAFLAAYEQALAEERALTVVDHFAPLDRWFEQRINPGPHGLTISVQDITDRKTAELDLQRSEERYRVLTSALSDAVWRSDNHGQALQDVDWERITGGASIGRPWVELIHPDDFERVGAAWRTALRRGTPFDERYRVRGSGGSWRHVRARGVPVGPPGAPREWIGVVFDLTEEVVAHEALRRSAEVDGLTGLSNRSAFVGCVRRLIERGTSCGAIIYLDIDLFKPVNDRFGHGAGDRVLQSVGDRLRRSVRPGDVVSRLSGDEFAILCDDLPEVEEAVAIAERVLAAVDQPLESDERIRVTASAGIASFGGGGQAPRDASEALRAADAALYRAKARGGATVEVYDAALRARLQRRALVERELRHGLEHDGLQLHFQPIVPLGGNKPVCLEALLRWRGSDGETLPAPEVVSVAEQTGLIHAIGREVLRSACAHAARWQRDGRRVGVAVNISPRQIARRSALVDDVADALAAAGLEPALLTLEITETVLMENMAQGEETLHALRELGVMLEIDDFGVGYSSLSYLRRLPVDALKLDRSFVAGLPDDGGSEKIVDAVVSLGRAFDIDVTAEGVETPAHLAAVRAAGVDAVQGYLLARPAPVEQALGCVDDACARLDGTVG